MKKVRKLFISISALFLAIFAGSCEIGLGEAVDTQSPTVDISYPPENRVIMGTFVLAGNCNDDTSVSTVYVTLENASENAEVKKLSYEQNLEGDAKTWRVNVNNLIDNKYELPDGKWTANVYVKDSAGRTSGTVSRSFDIDNTAPSLVLSNPSTVGDASSPITFGAIIQIKGEITETHETSNLRFYYQKADASGLVGTEQYIDRGAVTGLSSDTPFVIARNYDAQSITTEELRVLKENYDKIHLLDYVTPATGEIDQKVYCAFELYDNARIYTNPDDTSDPGAGQGNISTKYSVKANETSVSTSGNTKITADSSCFILNPDNAPRYSIGVYEFTPKDSDGNPAIFQKLATGTKINLSLKAGKDNSPIKPKTVSITAKEVSDEGIELPGDPITILAEGDWNDTDDDVKVSKGIDVNKEMGFKQGSYYSISVAAKDRNDIDAVPESGKNFGFLFDSSRLPPSITMDYIFNEGDKRPGETGYVDNENKKIINDVKLSGTTLQNNIYIPVTIDTNGVAPNKDGNTLFQDIIKVFKTESTDNAANVGIRVRDATGADVTGAVVSYEMPNIKISEGNPNAAPSSTNFVYTEDGLIKFEIKITDIKKNGLDLAPGKYTCSFTLQIKGDIDNPKTATKSISFTVDNKAPEIKNATILPHVIVNDNGSDVTTVNGKVNFSLAISDNFELYDTAYKVTGVKKVPDPENPGNEIDQEVEIEKQEFNDTNPSVHDFNIAIDTYKDFTKKGYDRVRIYVKVKDIVGNIYDSEDDVVNRVYEYKIDQTQDKPVIELLNFSSAADANNLFESKNNLSLSITDDDGIGSVKYSFDNGNEETVPNVPNGKPFDIPLERFNTSAGEHTLTVKVTDSKNETESYAKNEVTSVKFFIDNEAPKISEKTIGSEASIFSNTLLNNDGKIVLNLEVSDDWDIASVECDDNTAVVADDFSKVTITPSSTDGNYTYTLTVTDKAGKTGQVIRNICVDSTNPTYVTDSAKIKSSKSHTGGAWYNKTSLEVEGKAEDLNGIQKVEYSLNGDVEAKYKDTLPIDSSKTVTDAVTGIQTVTFGGYISGISNGNNITLRITDNAGNKTVVTPTELSTIPIDTSKPEYIELTSEAGDKLSNGTAKYTITGKAKDNISGIQKVELVLKSEGNEVDVKEVTSVSSPDANDEVTWTYTDYETTSTGELYVRVTDNADWSAEKYLFKIETDSDLPVAEIKEVTYRKSESLLETDSNGKYLNANKIIVISGTASDARLDEVTLQYYNSSSGWVDYKTLKSTDEPAPDLNNWSFEVNTEDKNGDTAIFAAEQQFQIIAKDRAGNDGNQKLKNAALTEEIAKARKTIVINQDSDRPVIKITNFDLTGMTSDNANRIKLQNQKRVNFTVTDDDGVSEINVNVHKVNEDEDVPYVNVTTGYIDIPTDGPCNISFTVKDAEGRIFTTATNAYADSPKIIGNKGATPEFGNDTTKDSTLYLVVDNAGPEYAATTQYASKKSTDASYATATTNIREQIIGGDYNKLKISLSLKDANGIKEVKLSKKKSDTEYDLVEKKELENPSFNAIPCEFEITLDTSKDSIEYKLDFIDNLDNSTTDTFIVDIDNEAPSLDIDSHLENQVVGSNFVLKGKVDGADSGTTVKYIIDSNSTIEANNSSWSSAASLENAGAGFSVWRLYVDGEQPVDGYTHVDTHKKLFATIYSSVAEYYGGIVYKKETPAYVNKYTSVEPVYFHFLVTDGPGNTSVKDFALRFDPQGDIPTVEVKYPAYGKTLTGKIRVQGTSSVYQDNKIAGIYMQIDPKVSVVNDIPQTPSFTAWKGTNTTTAPDIKATNGTTSLSTKLDSSNPIEYIFSRCESVPSTIGTEYQNLFGIYVGNKSNWNITINNDGELGSTSANHIAIRMYIVDNHGNVNIVDSTDYTRLIVDSDVPAIGVSEEFAAYQFAWKNVTGTTTTIVYTNTPEPTTSSKAYSDSGCRTGNADITAVTAKNGNAKATITVDGKEYIEDFKRTPYVKNMWLKGEWWFTGSVEDNSGIKSVTVTSNSVETNVLSDDVTNASRVAKRYNCAKPETDSNTNYLISFRVGVQNTNTTAGELSYTVFIKEDETSNEKENEETFYINYDNKVPVVQDMELGNNKVITNSYGFYTLSSTAEEKGTQSGFARAVVYFTRNTEKSATTIYDPYIRVSKTGNAQSYSSLLYEDGLYWVTKTVSSVSSKNVTISETTDNQNIHKGSLVKLGGAYYKIDDISGTTLTLNNEPGELAANTPIYIALGIVIDQESEAIGSTYITSDEGYGYYNISDNDDFMVESAITNNGVTEWTGNINSNNLPDGPLTVHYVVYDNAGNYSTVKTIANCKVANNALRITGVKVWCDYNGNDTPDESSNESNSEVVSYYNNAVDVKIGGVMTKRAGSITTPSINTGDNVNFMTVKDTAYVYPEFIGGNGKILVKKTYRGTVQTVSGTTDNYAEFCDGNEGNDYSGVDEEKDESGYYRKDEQGNGIGYYQGRSGYSVTDAKTTPLKFVLSLSDLGEDSTSETDLKEFKFEFKDSTDGTANEASITMKFKVMCNDSEAPTIEFGKFRYDSTLSTKAKRKVTNAVPFSHVMDMDLTKGHVECEDDWIQTSKYSSEKTTNNWDTTNSKNVGKSSEYDADPKISGKVTIRGRVSDNQRIKEIWIKPKSSDTLTKVAEFSNGSVSVLDTTYKYNSTTGMGFEIEEEQNSQSGHVIYWAYTFDSNDINANHVAIDETFVMKAVDAAKGGNSRNTEKTYYMDIVPYIVTVNVPQLDKHNRTNPTVYSRTALGHYPLYSVTKDFTNYDYATVSISGFNIDKDKITSFVAESDVEKYLTRDNAVTDKIQFSVNSTSKTDGYVLTVTGGVKSLNNVNLATAAYNISKNNQNNNQMNDDVFFDIWDINAKAVVGPNGKIDDPVMKINPTNGLIGFAFTNGAERFCMPDTTTSYKKSNRSYDVMKYNALTYDKLGNSYAVSVGGDIDEKIYNGALSSTADEFSFMTSKWNNAVVGDNQGSNYGEDNHLRLESIGLSKDNKYYKKKDRFQSQSMATYVDGSNNTYLYLAYYDLLLNQVKLKAGVVPTSKGNFHNFSDVGNNAKSEANASNVQIIADGTNDTLGTAGQYVSIATTNDNNVVLIWWDGSALKYAYTSKLLVSPAYETKNNEKKQKGYIYPKGKANNPTDVYTDRKDNNYNWASDNVSGNRWSNVTSLSNMPGVNCKVIVDDNNGVHIAAYDDSGKLYYTYISSYSSPSSAYTCLVDSYNDVGEKLTIDVAKNGDYYVPYIGYWDNTLDLPRYAYLAKPENFQGDNAGTAQHNGYVETATATTVKGYTGVWDCTLVPTTSETSKNTVNVGVWKTVSQGNAMGTIKASTAKEGTDTWTTKYTSTTNGTSGKCYGNGSNNGVVSYLVKADSTTYIETAQKRD